MWKEKITMNYELAKKLKKMGFPHDWSQFEEHDPELLAVNWDMYGEGYCPTLSELIAACGENFGGLDLGYINIKYTNIENMNTEIGVKKWYAHSPKNKIGGDGSTPEEAVASLWLKLNEK